MKILNKLILFSSLLSIVYTSSINNFSHEINLTQQNVVKADVTGGYTIQDFCDYLQDKSEHYPLSDEFIERYQQTSGGYIDNAKKHGVPVDKTIHEPNQKWHFFVSWIEDGSIDTTQSAKSRVYTGLLCPELLLWIYEAMGVNPVKVKEAKAVAEKGKVEGTNVSTLAKNMRSVVSWEDLIVEISKQ